MASMFVILAAALSAPMQRSACFLIHVQVFIQWPRGIISITEPHDAVFRSYDDGVRSLPGIALAALAFYFLIPTQVLARMELNQIRYFVQLARVLNFTRAAEICGVTQPALTRGIQQLEKELGGPLFHRERNHTQLTELGQILLPSLERALMASQEARIQAEAFRKRETSPLRVGLEYSIPTAIITPVIATLRRHADEIELTLRQESGADLCDRMLSGELDFALLVEGPQLSERLHRWRLFDEDYVVVCPSDHRFKEREMVDLAELTQECLLLHQDPACPTRRFMTELCAQEHVRPRRQHFGNGLEQIFEMVQASLGISVAGARTPLTPMFFGRRFAAPGCNRTVVLSCVAGRRMGPTPSLFMKLMRARSWSAAVGANHGG